MKILPAIDLINGKCVRLYQGDFDAVVEYDHDPVDMAKELEDAGMKHLHLVDLDGAKAGKPQNLKVLGEIARQTSLQIEFGGGLKTKEDLSNVLDSGAHELIIGSMAVKDPQTCQAMIDTFGVETILLGADIREEKMAVDAWESQLDLDIYTFIESYKREEKYPSVVCTDILRDGAFAGIAVDLYAKIINAFPNLKLIASGGVSGLEDVEKAKNLGMSGIIIGKAIHDGRIDLKKLADYVN